MCRRDDAPPIAIIGGGICGLTTALALEQRGFTVDVYEAAAEYQPVGAGILLQTNALVAFETLGLAEEIRENREERKEEHGDVWDALEDIYEVLTDVADAVNEHEDIDADVDSPDHPQLHRNSDGGADD